LRVGESKSRLQLSVKKIYLVRHGQTDYNLQGIVQGSGIDAPLNALGKLQAAAFYEAYRHIPFDAVLTSALKRSIESMEGFLLDGIRHETHAALNEINWGVKEGARITPESDITYYNLLQSWQRGDADAAIEGGESARQVAKRQLPILERLRSNQEEKNVLVCMHGRAMRILLCQLLKYDLRYMEAFEHHNLCLYVLADTGSMYSVKHFCDFRHLEGVGEAHPVS
jgi:broad specificity phosphatase PhoE